MIEALAADVLHDPIILWMFALTAVLVLVALFVGALTASLRYANVRKEVAWRRLESVWTPLMIRVLAGEIPPRDLLEAVHGDDRYLFIDFLTHYGTRFDDHERRLIEKLAAPHLSLLASRIDSPDVHIRIRAVLTIGLLGAHTHADVLLKALDAEAPLIVLAAARALCSLQEETVVRSVLDGIHKADSWSVDYLARVVATAGASAARPCQEILGSSEHSPWLRVLAAETLRQIHNFESADLARALIVDRRDTPRNVLCACLRMIRDMGTERHLDAVRHLWGAEDDTVRLNAVAALGGAGTAQDLPRLRLMLQDRSQWVVWAAVRGLLGLGDRAFLDDLIRAGHRAAAAAQAVIEESAEGFAGPLHVTGVRE